MSPSQAPIFFPVLVLSLALASFYINIRMAKKRVTRWRPGSAYWFWRSHGLTGINKRAKLVWMERLGYDEIDALILAKYQSQAFFFAFFGNALFVIVAANFIKH